MKLTKIFAGILLLVVTAIAAPYVLAGLGVSLAMIFTPSPIMNEMRKKAGSDVFSKNHYGGFVRKRVKGSNPHTPKQINVRAFLTALAKGWKGLTQVNRDGWNSYASGLTLKNRLGQSITLTGEATYIKLNRILQTIVAALLTDPPSTSAVPPSLVDTPHLVIVSATSVTVTTANNVDTNNKAMLYLSKPMSQGKKYNSSYRFVGTYTLADTTTKDITTAYQTVFGTLPVTGERVFLKIKSTDGTTGLQNQAQSVSVIV